MKRVKAKSSAGEIRAATDEELAWVDAEPDPDLMARMKEAEIEEALTATSRPRHWEPVEVDPTMLR